MLKNAPKNTFFNKNGVLILFFLLAGLFYFRPAFAYVLYQQPVKTNCIDIPANSTYPLSSTTSFVASSTGKISQISLLDNSCGSQSNSGEWLIYDNNNNLLYTSPSKNNEYWRIPAYFNDNLEGKITDGITIYSGQSYKITWRTDIGNGNYNSWYADNNNIFNLSLISASSSITLIYPVNNSTTTDFTTFYLSYHQATTSVYSANSEWVYYSQNTGDFNDLFNYTGFVSVIDNTALNNDNQAINKINNLSVGTWYAEAVLYNNVSSGYPRDILATSSIISFNIVSGFPVDNYYTAPTSTASSSQWVITCDQTSGLFQYSLCYLAQYLFIPNPAVLNQYSGIIDQIKYKAPIGYFALISSALSGISSTTPAIVINTIAPVNNSIFNPVKTGLVYIFWFIFAFWLFERLRHFNLTSP